MSKTELPVPVLAVGLAVAFLFVSTVVLLTRNPRWIQRKLRIGALLLGLTAATTACPQPTCYDPVMPENPNLADAANVYTLEGQSVGTVLTVDLAEGNTLVAEVSARDGAVFSYRLAELAGPEIERNNLTAADGAFDEESEELEIQLPLTLTPGTYVLGLFATTAVDQPIGVLNPFQIEIVE